MLCMNAVMQNFQLYRKCLIIFTHHYPRFYVKNGNRKIFFYEIGMGAGGGGGGGGGGWSIVFFVWGGIFVKITKLWPFLPYFSAYLEGRETFLKILMGGCFNKNWGWTHQPLKKLGEVELKFRIWGLGGCISPLPPPPRSPGVFGSFPNRKNAFFNFVKLKE